MHHVHTLRAKFPKPELLNSTQTLWAWVECNGTLGLQHDVRYDPVTDEYVFVAVVDNSPRSVRFKMYRVYEGMRAPVDEDGNMQLAYVGWCLETPKPGESRAVTFWADFQSIEAVPVPEDHMQHLEPPPR